MAGEIGLAGNAGVAGLAGDIWGEGCTVTLLLERLLGCGFRTADRLALTTPPIP